MLANGARTNDQPLINWAVTVAFYSAVHCIEAELANHALHPRNHKERSDCMQSVGLPSEVCLAYDILKDLSEQSRYAMRDFDPVVVDRSVLNHYLPRVAALVGL